MKRIIYLFIFILSTTQIFVGQEIIHIDPERTTRGTLTLSDLIESIEYIPLETKKNCLIGDIISSVASNQLVLLSDNYILVNCITTLSYYLFNRSGKFIAKIGNRGQGPGEYFNSIGTFEIDEDNNHIIISSSKGMEFNQLMYYDLKGKFLYSINVDKVLTDLRHVKFNDYHFVMHTNNPWRAKRDPPFNYSIFSNDYQLLSQHIKTTHYSIAQLGAFTFPTDYSFYFYEGQLHVRNMALNDTLYCINKNLSFYPKYIINAGKYALTTQILSDPELYKRRVSGLALFISVFETDKYLFFSYLYNKKMQYQYYDKSLHRLMQFNSASGIPNDYDGGFDFWPKQQNGNKFISWYHAYQFEDNDNKLIPKAHRKDIEKFKKLKKIDPEDNPVLVIIKMKE